MQDGWWLVCSESGQATAQSVVQLLFQGASRAELIRNNPSSSRQTAHPRSHGAAPAACGSAAPAGRGRHCTPCSAVAVLFWTRAALSFSSRAPAKPWQDHSNSTPATSSSASRRCSHRVQQQIGDPHQHHRPAEWASGEATSHSCTHRSAPVGSSCSRCARSRARTARCPGGSWAPEASKEGREQRGKAGGCAHCGGAAGLLRAQL